MLDSFFGVHPALIRLGIWKRLKDGEKDLYICILHRSERLCNRVLVLTDAQIREDVGAAPRTLCNARKKLREYGLIRCDKISGNKYRYTICNPATREPYPGASNVPITCSKGTRQKHSLKGNATPETGQTKPDRLEDHGLIEVFCK